jgi:hypothetical protein
LDLKKREKLIKGWDVKIKKKKIKGSTLLPIISCTYLPHFPFMSIFITWSYFRKFHLSIMYFIFVFFSCNLHSSVYFLFNLVFLVTLIFTIDCNQSLTKKSLTTSCQICFIFSPKTSFWQNRRHTCKTCYFF